MKSEKQLLFGEARRRTAVDARGRKPGAEERRQWAGRSSDQSTERRATFARGKARANRASWLFAQMRAAVNAAVQCPMSKVEGGQDASSKMQDGNQQLPPSDRE